MKTALFKFIAGLALATLPIAGFASEGAGGHGGGGIINKGQYQSFYGAGFYTEPVLASDSGPNVPQMDALILRIQNFPSMSATSKAVLMAAIIPSPNRTYLKIAEASFDTTTRTRLIEVYADTVKQPKANLDVFAVTDISKKQTFLLPGFYKLSAMDQMAILFHEAFWILNPDAKYDYVVKAEMAFEAVLDRPNDPIRVLEFMKYYSKQIDRVKAALAYDQKNGTSPVTIKLVDFLGPDYLASVESSVQSPVYVDINLSVAPTYQYFQSHLNSALVRVLKTAYDTLEISFGGDKSLAAGGYYAFHYFTNLNHPVDLKSCVISLQLQQESGSESYWFPMTCSRKAALPDTMDMVGDSRIKGDWNRNLRKPVTGEINF